MYLVLALSSGLFWGIWGFGYGRYARAMSHYSVILFTASGAIVVYVIAGTFGQDFLLDSIDIRSGLIGGSPSLLGSVMLLKAVSVGKCGVASGVSATYVLVPLAYSIAIGEAVPTLAIVGSFVIVIGLAGVSFYTAADMGDLGIASVLSSISPVATAVLAYVFLKEKLIRTEVTALLVSLAGIALVVV